MEPLSAAASIVAVVGAARKAAEGLQSLKAIKDAPKELEDLLFEFSQIEIILQSYKNLPTNCEKRSGDLATILDIAEKKFDELDKLVHYTLTKAGGNEQVDRLQWVRKRSDTERLREQLSQILVTLNTLLNTTSFTTVQEIAFTTNEVLNEQKRTQSKVLAVVPEFALAASQMRQRIEESQATQLELLRLLSHVRQANLTGSFGGGKPLLRADDGPTGQLIKPESRVGSDHERKLRKVRTPSICQRYCRCNCHRTQRISTPWTLRKCIGFGSMQISGRYALQQCNITDCKQSASSNLRLDYILPRWFAGRMLSIWYNSAPLYGPELLLRVPVVLPWPTLESFEGEQWFNLRNEHIDHWLHTPSHIDERGMTLFYWAVDYGRYDIIDSLLDMGLDLRQSVSDYESSYTMLWKYFGDCLTRVNAALQVETARKVDWDEYIEDGGLAELHLTVSGLRDRNLETYIRAHPEELEKTDAFNNSPLWYASRGGELADIRTLLKYGATLNEDTFDLPSFFSRVGSKGLDFLDEHLSPGTLKCLFKGGWPRAWFFDLYDTRIDIDEILAVDKLCLEHGFDVNNKDYEGETPLMAMQQGFSWCLPLRVKQLLDHGADLELTDIYGKTALHHCIENHVFHDTDVRNFSLLIEYKARLNYRTNDGTTILHALILHIAYVEPMEVILDSDVSGLVVDAKDSNGHTAFDLLVIRARLSRQELGECSVSLEASGHVDSVADCGEYTEVLLLGKWRLIANDPDRELKILTALEALLHKVQEVQGIPPEEQYPSIESVLDQEDIDAEASRLEGLPGSWPE